MTWVEDGASKRSRCIKMRESAFECIAAEAVKSLIHNDRIAFVRRNGRSMVLVFVGCESVLIPLIRVI